MYHSIMNSTKSQIRFIPRFGLYIYNFIFLYICDENYNNYFLLLELLMSIIKEAKCYHYPSYFNFFSEYDKYLFVSLLTNFLVQLLVSLF